MSEPVVSYSVREMFGRIEGKLDELAVKVVALESAGAARDAVGRARAAMWTAGVSAVAAVSALIVVLFQH